MGKNVDYQLIINLFLLFGCLQNDWNYCNNEIYTLQYQNFTKINILIQLLYIKAILFQSYIWNVKKIICNTVHLIMKIFFINTNF